MKALIVSVGLNVVLAMAVAAAWLRGAPALPQDPATGLTAPTLMGAPQAGSHERPSGLSGPDPSCAASLARCQGEELPRCVAEVAALGRRVTQDDARNLEKVFEGGEPNPPLADRVRRFFSAQSKVECHDVVCRIDEPGSDEDVREWDDKRMTDPYYRALESQARLTAGPDGTMHRLVRVEDARALDGERVLEHWLHMRGPDAVVACGAEQAGEHAVVASIDSEGRVTLESVSGSGKGPCLQERLEALRPAHDAIPTRPARIDRPLPNPFAAGGVPPPRPR